MEPSLQQDTRLNLETAVDSSFPLESPMTVENLRFTQTHQCAQSAMHLMKPHCCVLSALFLLVGHGCNVPAVSLPTYQSAKHFIRWLTQPRLTAVSRLNALFMNGMNRADLPSRKRRCKSQGCYFKQPIKNKVINDFERTPHARCHFPSSPTGHDARWWLAALVVQVLNHALHGPSYCIGSTAGQRIAGIGWEKAYFAGRHMQSSGATF